MDFCAADMRSWTSTPRSRDGSGVLPSATAFRKLYWQCTWARSQPEVARAEGNPDGAG